MNASYSQSFRDCFTSALTSGPTSRACLLTVAVALSQAAACSAQPVIQILKGSHQQTVYASTFPAPLVVWVTDSETRQPLTGARVEFKAGNGISLSAPEAVTDEHGLASVAATGLAVGVSNATAELIGFPAVRASFSELVVNKATLTVVPVDLEMQAGDQVPALHAYKIEGFVNGDKASVQISGVPELTTTAKDNSPHANYAIKGGVGTLSAPNYTFAAGFGTLAVLGNGGSDSRATEVSNAATRSLPTVEVRPALMNELAAMSLREPAFLAGLHGESGIFVQSAISQNVAKASLAFQPSAVRTVTLPASGSEQTRIKATEVPVRPAAIPRSVIASTANLNGIVVHPAVIVSNTTTAGPSSSLPGSYSGSSIRKALILPGTK